MMDYEISPVSDASLRKIRGDMETQGEQDLPSVRLSLPTTTSPGSSRPNSPRLFPPLLQEGVRSRRHSREGSDCSFDDLEMDSEEVIPREATTNPRIQRRRRRTESSDSQETLQLYGQSSNIVVPGTPRHRGSFRAAPIFRLEKNMLTMVLSFLPFRDRFVARRVCKHWFNVIMQSHDLVGSIDLSVESKRIEDTSLLSIGGTLGPLIRQISLRNCWSVTDRGFQSFVRLLPNLETMDLNSCWELTDQSVSDLRLCPSLTRLDLSNCRKVSDQTLTAILTGAPSLKELKLSYCKNLTNSTMATLCRNSKQMATLYLQRCTTINDGGFMPLRSPESFLPQLNTLSLSDCSFLTDEAILSISIGCPNLKVLNLSFCCALSSEALEHLASGCKQLVSLDLSFCGNAVYDEGLEVISLGLPRLERLSFRSCIMVTERGLQYLVDNSANLQILNPSSCKNITPAVLARVPATWQILSGNVPLHEAQPSSHFPKTSADGKFFA